MDFKMKKTKLGVIGCGMISGAYLKAASRFRNIEIVAGSDIVPGRAAAKRDEFKEFGYSEETFRAYDANPDGTNAELLSDPEIEVVLNLTPPKQHSRVDLEILNAGKHAYSEKPFGVNLEDAMKVMKLAEEKNLRCGCAPDTFLGGGQQTARKLIDDGWIGKPLAGTALVMGRGPEKWPQAPFFFDYGAGPMLDLGPYYITTLVNMLGPAKRVTAFTKKFDDMRTGGPETQPPVYPINVTTHLTGVIEFECGALITMISSFDVWKHGHCPIEIYGSEGSLQVPDPNTFGGPDRVFRKGYEDWQDVPMPFGYTDNSRSIGAVDMVNAIKSGRPHRANNKLAYHVLEIMCSFDKSSSAGRPVDIESTCERPAPLPLGLDDGFLDD